MHARVAGVGFAILLVGANWPDYRSASVSGAWRKAAIGADSDHTIETADVKFTVVTQLMGAHRPAIGERLEFLHKWPVALGHPGESASMFVHAIQTGDAKKEYCLRFQNPLLEPFAREATAGPRAQPRITYLGAAGRDKVFAVNAFQVLASASATACS